MSNGSQGSAAADFVAARLKTGRISDVDRTSAARIESLECRVFLSDVPWGVEPAAREVWSAPPVVRADEPSPASRPAVTSTTPADGASGILRDAFISSNLSVIGGAGIDK